jgi:hypothetical protein
MRRKWWLVCVLVVAGLFCIAWLQPCVVRVPEGGARSQALNRVKCITLALHAYHDVHGQLPPAVVRDKDGRPLYSWRVAILPYIEEYPLYQKFKLDEPWDSPHNQALVAEIPRWYSHSGLTRDPPGTTRFQVFVGTGTAFERPGLSLADFTDGTENTLLVVEAGTPVVWSAPTDLPYDPAAPLPPLGGVWHEDVMFLCREVGSRPAFIAAFADGKVRLVRQSIGEQPLRAAITRNGGEPFSADRLD